MNGLSDYISIAEASKSLGIPRGTLRNMLIDFGLGERIGGLWVVHKKNLPELKKKRRRPGNQRWINDGEAAAADAVRAVVSRESKKKTRSAKR